MTFRALSLRYGCSRKLFKFARIASEFRILVIFLGLLFISITYLGMHSKHDISTRGISITNHNRDHDLHDQELNLIATEDISLNRNLTLDINEHFVLETNTLQIHLSHVLFWQNDTPEETALHAQNITNTHIVQRNYAILHHMTRGSTTEPIWNSYLDFSVSSISFTQLYFIEVFKPDLKPNIQFKSAGPEDIQLYEPLFFPWLKTPIIDLYNSFSGKGIVITTGNKHFEFAFLLVKTIRLVLKCDLPIEFIYANHNDLTFKNRQRIKQFKDIKLIDMSEIVDSSQLQGTHGWWNKVFTILMSSFKEVIFIEADVLFTKNPEILFNHPNYLKYGHLIYHDRRIKFGHHMDFEYLKRAFPFASDTLKKTSIWNQTSDHEAESGVLVYNKSNIANFFALLNTCNLNRNPMFHHVENIFWGDKETFWMGFELLNLQYAFDEQYGGTVGYKRSDGSVCGPLAHSDDKGELIWFNGGLSGDKGKLIDKIVELSFYTSDDIIDAPGNWHWIEGGRRVCWQSARPETQVRTFSKDQKQLLDLYVEMFKEIRKGKFLVDG